MSSSRSLIRTVLPPRNGQLGTSLSEPRCPALHGCSSIVTHAERSTARRPNARASSTCGAVIEPLDCRRLLSWSAGPVGPAYTVTELSQSQHPMPRLLSDRDSTVVHLWKGVGATAWGMYSQVFHDGAPVAAPQLLVPGQSWVDADMNAQGELVVGWGSGVGGSASVQTFKVNAQGTLIETSGVMAVASVSGRTVLADLRVAIGDSGGFVVAWEETPSQRSTGSEIRARIYAASGTNYKAGKTFTLAGNAGERSDPSVDMAADGSFVATWTKSNTTILGHRFAPGGQGLGGEFAVTAPGLPGKHSNVAVAPDGASFVVAYTANLSTGSTVAYRPEARHYQMPDGLEGSLLPGATQVLGQSTNLFGPPRPAMADDGSFVVAWSEHTEVAEPDVSLETWTEVLAQGFAPDGTPAGGVQTLASAYQHAFRDSTGEIQSTGATVESPALVVTRAAGTETQFSVSYLTKTWDGGFTALSATTVTLLLPGPSSISAVTSDSTHGDHFSDTQIVDSGDEASILDDQPLAVLS